MRNLSLALAFIHLTACSGDGKALPPLRERAEVPRQFVIQPTSIARITHDKVTHDVARSLRCEALPLSPDAPTNRTVRCTYEGEKCFGRITTTTDSTIYHATPRVRIEVQLGARESDDDAICADLSDVYASGGVNNARRLFDEQRAQPRVSEAQTAVCLEQQQKVSQNRQWCMTQSFDENVVYRGACCFGERALTLPGNTNNVTLSNSGRWYVTGLALDGGLHAYVEKRNLLADDALYTVVGERGTLALRARDALRNDPALTRGMTFQVHARLVEDDLIMQVTDGPEHRVSLRNWTPDAPPQRAQTLIATPSSITTVVNGNSVHDVLTSLACEDGRSDPFAQDGWSIRRCEFRGARCSGSFVSTSLFSLGADWQPTESTEVRATPSTPADAAFCASLSAYEQHGGGPAARFAAEGIEDRPAAPPIDPMLSCLAQQQIVSSNHQWCVTSSSDELVFYSSACCYGERVRSQPAVAGLAPTHVADSGLWYAISLTGGGTALTVSEQGLAGNAELARIVYADRSRSIRIREAFEGDPLLAQAHGFSGQMRFDGDALIVRAYGGPEHRVSFQ